MRPKIVNAGWTLALPLIVAVMPSIGTAAPLAKEACDALKSEQVSLTSSGLRADLARGAAWGKVNLAADRIKKVERLIEVDEQILFRCASPAPPEVEADTTAEAKPKPKPKVQAQKPVQKAAEKPAEAAASGAGGKLAPQSAKATDDAPAKPNKAEIAAEKKRAAAVAKAQAQTGNEPPRPRSKPRPSPRPRPTARPATPSCRLTPPYRRCSRQPRKRRQSRNDGGATLRPSLSSNLAVAHDLPRGACWCRSCRIAFSSVVRGAQVAEGAR